jgi:two-component system LytT family response regulator
MVSVIIADDEQHCIDTLKIHLDNLSDVHVIATASNGSDFIKLAMQHKPDLVFMDIQMPVLTGLELLESMGNVDFKTIFVTAYDQFALRALKLNALDYLLKPVSLADIVTVVEKYKNRQLQASLKQYQLAQTSYKKIDLNSETITLSVSDGLHFIKTNEIILLEGMGAYTKVVTKAKAAIVASKTLSAFEEILLPHNIFFRVHKSFIINLCCVKKYIRGEGGEVIMENDTVIAVSRTRKQEFLNCFAKI